MELIFATNNAHKITEMQSAVGNEFEIITLQQAGIDIDIPEPHDTLEANALEADWDSVSRAANGTLANALSMMSPYGAAEKQVLLEAPDLRTRAETLIAGTSEVQASIIADRFMRLPKGGKA